MDDDVHELVTPDGWDDLDDDALDEDERQEAVKVTAELRKYAETQGHSIGIGWMGWQVTEVTKPKHINEPDDQAFGIILPGDVKVIVTVQVV